MVCSMILGSAGSLEKYDCLLWTFCFICFLFLCHCDNQNGVFLVADLEMWSLWCVEVTTGRFMHFTMSVATMRRSLHMEAGGNLALFVPIMQVHLMLFILVSTMILIFFFSLFFGVLLSYLVLASERTRMYFLFLVVFL